MYQQGNLNLSVGVTSYTVSFAESFLTAPSAIFTQIYNSTSPTNSMWLEAVVTSRNETGFTVDLLVAPPTSGYVLSWLAGTGEITNSGGGTGGSGSGSGIPFESLPVLLQNQLPLNASFPVVVPGVVSKAFRVSWQKLLSMIGNNHNHYINQIVNSTPIGRKLMAAVSAVAARTAISAAADIHVHLAADISDSTGIGRLLLAAPTESAARAAIDAAASVHAHVVNDITDATTLGKQLLTATTPEEVRTISESAAAVHTHVADDITDATTIGKELLTAATAAAGRGSINALYEAGWNGVITVTGGTVNVTDLYLSKKVQVGTANVTAVFNPFNVSVSYGRLAFNVAAGLLVNLVGNNGATFSNQFGDNLGTTATLSEGFYVLENVNNVWVVTNYVGTIGKNIILSDTAAEVKTLLQISTEDIVDAGAAGKDVVKADTNAEILDLIGALASSYVIVNVGSSASVNISSTTTTTLNNKLFVAGISTSQTLTLDNVLGTLVGQRFVVFAKSEQVTLDTSGIVRVNDGSTFTTPIVLTPGQMMEFTVTGLGTNSDLITTNLSSPTQADTVWVAGEGIGNDLTGRVGNPNFPFRTLTAAATTSASVCYVTPGSYTEEEPLPGHNKQWYFSPNTTITYAGLPGTYLFNVDGDYTSCRVYGYGYFYSYTNCGILKVTGTLSDIQTVQFEADTLAVDGNNVVYLTGTMSLTNSYIKVKRMNGAVRNDSIISGATVASAFTITADKWISPSVFTGSVASNYPVHVETTNIACNTLKNRTASMTGRVNNKELLVLSSESSGSYAGITSIANDNCVIRSGEISMLVSTGPTILHNGGRLVIENAHIKGRIEMSSSGLTLRDCSNDTTVAINSIVGSPQNLRIIGSLTTNMTPNTEGVEFIGGNVHIDANIFTA